MSKRIGCLISSLENEEKYLIIFTCGGYRKLFSKVTALEREALCLDLFIPQAFIRPMNEPQILEQREESFFTFPHYELKMSELQFTIVNYNTTSKKISIEIAIHNYYELQSFDDLYTNMSYLLMEVIGEINYRKHIKNFELTDLKENQRRLVNISQLQECIDHLYIRKPKNQYP